MRRWNSSVPLCSLEVSRGIVTTHHNLDPRHIKFFILYFILFRLIIHHRADNHNDVYSSRSSKFYLLLDSGYIERSCFNTSRVCLWATGHRRVAFTRRTILPINTRTFGRMGINRQCIAPGRNIKMEETEWDRRREKWLPSFNTRHDWHFNYCKKEGYGQPSPEPSPGAYIETTRNTISSPSEQGLMWWRGRSRRFPF